MVCGRRPTASQLLWCRGALTCAFFVWCCLHLALGDQLAGEGRLEAPDSRRVIVQFAQQAQSSQSGGIGVLEVQHGSAPALEGLAPLHEVPPVARHRGSGGGISASTGRRLKTGGSTGGSGSGSGNGDVTYVYRVAGNLTAAQAAEKLQGYPGVVAAEPDRPWQAQAQPNDAFYDLQWHLPKIGAPAAWEVSKGLSNPQVRVCIVDTGIRRGHQDLEPKLIAGWNRGIDGSGRMPPEDAPAFNDLSDPSGHGTHVSGTISAATNNRIGVAGVSWQAGLLFCKAADAAGTLWTSSLLDCYARCSQAGAKIISNSYGATAYSWAAYKSIQALREAGVLFVAAAGNSGSNNDARGRTFPASYHVENVISVAASDREDNLASFSNYGRVMVDLAAPGVDIYSTYNTGDAAYSFQSGTSTAAPVVAGAAALLWAVKPGASYQEIKAAILSTVELRPGLAGKVATGGRLNLAAAVARVTPPPPVLPTPVPKLPQKQPGGDPNNFKSMPVPWEFEQSSRGVGPPAYAGDGRTHTFSSTRRENRPWWAVRLKRPYHVFGVQIVLRRNAAALKFMRDLEVRVANTGGARSYPLARTPLLKSALCTTTRGQLGTSGGERVTLLCQKPLTGDILSIHIRSSRRRRDILTMAEVLLWAQPVARRRRQSSG